MTAPTEAQAVDQPNARPAATAAQVAAAMEVVLAHESDGLINSRDRWVGCICGERLPCLFEGADLDWDDDHKVRARHLAPLVANAVVAAADAEQDPATIAATDPAPVWWDADHNRPADVYCPPERQCCRRCGLGRMIHGDQCRPARRREGDRG